MNENVYTAPDSTLTSMRYSKRIFLGGTIDMGNSEDWQKKAISLIQSKTNSTCIYNPRRKNWDSSWEQSIHNIYFKQQVDWELDCLEKSTHIIMYFGKDSKSPISLLELGLFARTGRVHVICPDGYYRKGNVDIVCNNYRIPQYNSLEELITLIF